MENSLLFFGGTYEVRQDLAAAAITTKAYYAIAGQVAAMRTVTATESTLSYFLTDHLGSTSAILDESGTLTNQQRFLPFGQPRADVPTPFAAPTDFGYTGQRLLDPGMGGLMDYKARFYSPYLNRFIQPDTLIPGAGDPQAWNRYAYVLNSPVRYSDPSGHMVWEGGGGSTMGDKWWEDRDLRNRLKNIHLIFNNGGKPGLHYHGPRVSRPSYPKPEEHTHTESSGSSSNETGFGVSTPPIGISSSTIEPNNIMSVNFEFELGVIVGNKDSVYWPLENGYSIPSVTCQPVKCIVNTGALSDGNGGILGTSGSVEITGPHLTEGVEVYYQREIVDVPYVGSIMPFGTMSLSVTTNYAKAAQAVAVAYTILSLGQLKIPVRKWEWDPVY